MQVTALAYADNKVVLSILMRIEPTARREIHCNIVALRRSRKVYYMPQELWDIVVSNLSSFSAKNIAEVLSTKLTENLSIHESVWRSCFQDETWLQLAFAKYNTNPVLLGVDLLRIPEKPKKNKNCYLVLLADDWSGDLSFHGVDESFETFRNSLQEHTYYSDGIVHEIYFSSGITLNITQVITGCEYIQMPNLQVLFELEKGVQTAYCPWSSFEQGPIVTVKGCDIVGNEGTVEELQNINPICAVSLSCLKQQSIHQIFCQVGSSSSLLPVYKNGETYPKGKIQGKR
ncbi:hypothetical protein AG0111_0g12100 [Alternaria gaisen]|uniref:Uncharacterized protein n=1 Tax=Alternaria gaisen TaxID=167740 RepID=A0ACB6F5C7_9PLEO|nr:hypothetical protein AG0111_0g12100 [Alternaria gaisen]